MALVTSTVVSHSLRHTSRVLALAVLSIACGRSDQRPLRDPELAPYIGTDSMGAMPANVRELAVNARPDLVESSAAVVSDAQPGIVFTVNDSGNDALLFAIDTTGADRGAWRIANGTNGDWEALALGPCAASSDSTPAAWQRGCLYIGDVGDNARMRSMVTLYRVAEPAAEQAGFTGSLIAEQLTFRYPDMPHDVEAMYVARNGSVFLISKRPLKDASGHRRPALVFSLDKSAWGSRSIEVAHLVDSLPIVPGSNALRTITDASLSPDGRHLAVRTYGQVYVFDTDSITGRVRASAPFSVCNVAQTEREHGEGISWYGAKQELLLSSEGRSAPLHVITCPLPSH
jgi:hypothetical protein